MLPSRSGRDAICRRRFAAHLDLEERLDGEAGDLAAGGTKRVVVGGQVDSLPAARRAHALSLGQDLAVERGVGFRRAELLAERQVGEEQGHAAGLDMEAARVALADIRAVGGTQGATGE